jgi:hypothetical protein
MPLGPNMSSVFVTIDSVGIDFRSLRTEAA